jgi:hypothetical protein
MTDYVRLDTTYDTINLYNVDSRKKGSFTSYRNIYNIDCDTSANLFQEFGQFSKYFICKEHAPNTYKESVHYDVNKMIQQPHCPRCNNLPPAGFNNIPTYTGQTEKIIQKKVRQASSSRTDVMKTRSAKDKQSCVNGKWSWNTQSSSVMASIISSNNVPSRGNSTKTTLTRHRPGAASAPGKGVDIKHNSYERYLLKRKNKSLAC